jgi:hypothetical protein
MPLTVMAVQVALAQIAPIVRKKEKRTSSTPITLIFVRLIATSLRATKALDLSLNKEGVIIIKNSS